ncbi:photosystem II reaction center protein W [Chloropicon primus]|uniref:PSII 6.1 kDa protein n=1 Tax=Chloropicon primus TaxID=1764295 RepID=A0A5B8MQN7_9CHLO|nr:photosystem II reaction center protein W [Chloropicon primus]UPR01947.1 photosystem II reaction center protein W [Chloropicon primus]|mmetsp:Transcript_13897/g.39208  ORF Transcript_13897/g.39208 Transcript_13897/m.39208 type:complete len:129 (-) Transcript_13897:927-1313(-)|eukprot:QDZ22723.1 photosystem II reaction center protein W [Chloropicon primus]
MIAKCTMTTRTTACVRQTTACSVRRQATVAKVAKPDRFAEAKKVLRKELPKIEAAAVVGAATLTASPAFALVDRRLNGDGTRLPFGINDPILGWILVAVFGGVWAVFSQSTGELGAGEEDGEDGGLSL